MSREYVGIDLHRRRSVIVRKNADGELLPKTRIVNEPEEMIRAVEAAMSGGQRVRRSHGTALDRLRPDRSPHRRDNLRAVPQPRVAG